MRRLAFFMTVGLLLAPINASAQFVAGAPTGDVHIKADKSVHKGGKTILTGKVDIRQGDVQIFADKMTIYRDKSQSAVTQGIGSGAISKIEADGNFEYITPENTVTGKRGVYEREKNIITVTGNVRVRQPNGNTARTQRLIYNVDTRAVRFDGNCLGAGCKKTRTTVRIGG